MSAESQRQARIASFLKLADEELEAAERLATALPRQSVYFVQQTVEKLLRALLEAEGIPAGVSHNIRYLCELLPEQNALKPQFASLDALSAASTRYRYPSASGGLFSPSQADVLDWLTRVKPLRAAVVQTLELKS